jgi:hypothetical protein
MLKTNALLLRQFFTLSLEEGDLRVAGGKRLCRPAAATLDDDDDVGQRPRRPLFSQAERQAARAPHTKYVIIEIWDNKFILFLLSHSRKLLVLLMSK